jgi:hypothetical protein
MLLPKAVYIGALLLLPLLAYPLAAVANPQRPLFGDTHVHTSYSFDAYLNQNRSADPDTAFRYARGLPVIHPYHRARVQIETPLDFLVVSDHAELLGFMPAIAGGDAALEDLGWWGNFKRWLALALMRRAIDSGLDGSKTFSELLPAPPEHLSGDPVQDPSNQGLVQETQALLGDISGIARHAWEDITETADRHNDPGVFTAFSGWEWSSIPAGANLHRVVITPEGADLSQCYLPFGSGDSQYPEDLWRWLDQTSTATSARFLAIPHNSNISKGYMFAETTLRGEPMTADYARTRRRWEPLVEITQIKGDSETHPALSPDDPLADFESFPFYLQSSPTPYTPARGDFVRSALKTGLSIEARTGVNPYQFGVIGSTDAHTGLASAEENNFWGKLAIDSIPEHKSMEAMSNLPEKIEVPEGAPNGWNMSASGLAAVWASENTRDAIFEALMRREVYGTTGPRILLRVFGGWEFEASHTETPDLAEVGYRLGVPMGSELPLAGAGGTSPRLLIQAMRDPAGVNLEQVQVIKGWLDAHGNSHEKIFTAAGKADDTTGMDTVSVVWEDPEFDLQQAAFYYVRVIQLPTPRHSYYDKQALGMPIEASDTIRERAYGSSIWYTPPQ